MRLRDIIFLMLEGYSGDGSNFNVEAESGMDDVAEPQIKIEIRIDGPFNRQHVSDEIYEAAVHEITHLGQDTIEYAGKKCGLDYFACLTETEAFTSGLLARSNRTGGSLPDVIDEYLRTQVHAGHLSKQEVVQVKEIWMKQAQVLVPKLEAEKRQYAGLIADEVMDAIDSGKLEGRFVYVGYSQIAAFDPEDPEEERGDQFTVDFTVM